MVNDSDQAEYEVLIEADFMIGTPILRQRVGPREAVDFIEARTFETTGNTITVRWSRRPGGGDLQEWRYPLS